MERRLSWHTAEDAVQGLSPGELVILGVHGAQLVFTGGQDVAGLVAQLAHLLPQGISLPCSAPHLCL